MQLYLAAWNYEVIPVDIEDQYMYMYSIKAEWYY